MPSIRAIALLLSLLLALPACARIRVRQTTNSNISQQMVGSWSGGWTSLAGGTGGNVTLRLQLFQGLPVVSIDTQHPCLTDGLYSFTLQGAHMELRRDGIVVFAAEVDTAARHLVGTYSCTADEGSWTADWQHDLPPVGDLSGIWQGSFQPAIAQTAAVPFTMQVEQHWSAGFLTLSGEVVLTGLGSGFPVTSGQVIWNGSNFDLQLAGSDAGTTVLIQGTGTTAGGGTSSGLMLVQDTSGPVVLGSWSANRLP